MVVLEETAEYGSKKRPKTCPGIGDSREHADGNSQSHKGIVVRKHKGREGGYPIEDAFGVDELQQHPRNDAVDGYKAGIFVS